MYNDTDVAGRNFIESVDTDLLGWTKLLLVPWYTSEQGQANFRNRRNRLEGVFTKWHLLGRGITSHYWLDLIANGLGVLSEDETLEMLSYILDEPVSNNIVVVVAHEVVKLCIETNDTDITGSNRGCLTLILGKYTHGFSWEMMPGLENITVTRLPSIHHALMYAEESERASRRPPTSSSSAVSFILNPDGSLPRCEEFMCDYYKKKGWNGIVGRGPTKKEFIDMLQNSALHMYSGHGSGLQYYAEAAIAGSDLQCCIMLFGCSSVTMKSPGVCDPFGTALQYTSAGCPLLMGFLWNVFDRTTNRFHLKILNRRFEVSPDTDEEEKHRNNFPSSRFLRCIIEARNSSEFKYACAGAFVAIGFPCWDL